MLWLACPGIAQRVPDAHLYAAVAASEHRGGVPAIAWLCEEYLPTLAAWPAGLDPRGPFSLHLSHDGIHIAATAVSMPAGAVAFGSCVFEGGADAPQLVWRCASDGREEWFAPTDFALPTDLHDALATIGADALDVPRTVQLPVAIAHLAGISVDTDPRSALLRLAPALCGEATWLAERRGTRLHVCGRSDGGLMLPTTLLILAALDGSGEPTPLAVRAFAARDGDRTEATRQLGRPDRALDRDTLRALLVGEDHARLTAIDALSRQHAAAELPHIIAAADERHPLAELAAIDAVKRLWPIADADARQATRRALFHSASPRLRGLDVDALATGHGTPVPPRALPARARLVLALGLLALGLFWLWRREHHRLGLQHA